ncbi:MAG: DUF4395 domain-containing protein [Leptospiraceae bacterium]|nr:DUF4395 domain-containing protein [Leptospiraceae bacterium]
MKIGNFPELINESAAKIIALSVVIFSVLSILTQSSIPAFFLLYGFFARVLYGPKFDLMSILALKFIIPTLNLPSKMAFGPPKRFAQLIGLIFTIVGILFFYIGEEFLFILTFGILSIFAFLELALGFCAGCFMFSYLVKWKLLPESVCEKCSNINFDI